VYKRQLLISEPGWGKTAMMKSSAQKAVGDKYTFTRLESSTPPEKLKGVIDFDILLNEKRLVEKVDGTIFDKSAKLHLVDEMFRAPDVSYDILLDATDRQDIPLAEQPIMWGSTNFIKGAGRIAALRDRITFYCWISPSTPDIGKMLQPHFESKFRTELTMPGAYPTQKQLKEIQNAKVGMKARQAIVGTLQFLQAEAIAENFKISPRRIRKWANILFRAGMFYSGTNDFATVPKKAQDLLKYAYPTMTLESSKEWAIICTSIIDPMLQVLTEILETGHEKITQIAEMNEEERESIALNLGAYMADLRQSIDKLGGSDPRTEKLTKLVNTWYLQSLKGQAPQMESLD
jgi:hypothetical protein